MRIAPVAALLTLMLAWPALDSRVRSQGLTGAIEGRVTFAGTPPPPTVLTQDGDSQPVLYVDAAEGLRYAVVFLPDAPPGGSPAQAPATMNQRRFIFEPQVLAVRAGQTVRFTNDDPANHNVRAQDSTVANTFSINTAAGTVGNTHRFATTPPGRPVELSCDIHPWMAAWVYVFEHDRFAVTAADGRFRIAGVPAGRQRLTVRQPSGRLARDLAVDVRAGETTAVDVRFTSADPAARGETPAAFGWRCIPPPPHRVENAGRGPRSGCVAPRSNTPDILARRALPAGRIASLGTTLGSHHGLLGIPAR